MSRVPLTALLSLAIGIVVMAGGLAGMPGIWLGLIPLVALRIALAVSSGSPPSREGRAGRMAK